MNQTILELQQQLLTTIFEQKDLAQELGILPEFMQALATVADLVTQGEVGNPHRDYQVLQCTT